MAATVVVEQFPEVARIAADLVRHPEVARRWHEESACAGMSVGGLAAHLAGQAHTAVLLLSAPPRDSEAIPVEEHYRRAAWVHTGLDEEVNTAIRDGADEAAAAGPGALVAQLESDADALPRALGPVLAGTRDPDTVHVPWQGWSLSASDLLLTRAMEVLVHADDLAASVDVPTPQFPAETGYAVLGLLAAVAADRHGQTAMLRALSRPQRAEAPSPPSDVLILQ